MKPAVFAETRTAGFIIINSKSRTRGGNILDNYWKWAENVVTLQREIKVMRL